MHIFFTKLLYTIINPHSLVFFSPEVGSDLCISFFYNLMTNAINLL